MLNRIREDIETVFAKDPAARTVWEVICCYPGLHALWMHRLAHLLLLWQHKLLFLARLTDQYALARAQGFSDAELSELARQSIAASFAPDADKRRWSAEVDAWLATPEQR